MKRDVRVYLDDVLESIDRIKEYTTNVKKEKFTKSTEIQDAVIRSSASRIK